MPLLEETVSLLEKSSHYWLDRCDYWKFCVITEHSAANTGPIDQFTGKFDVFSRKVGVFTGKIDDITGMAFLITEQSE
ncbi:MAG: hypothetical protein COZ80_01855 [Ignavibacteria bacterium CG_4_8_14_3_um_filter_37_9]|nr:MAG: hypothetical protein COZ80_01855 [Ignavibacteria bacterium CG_4_8_14_3_um_filter_37_9]